jgi:hypothetical protein
MNAQVDQREREASVLCEQRAEAGARLTGVQPKLQGWGNPISFNEATERVRRVMEGADRREWPEAPRYALLLVPPLPPHIGVPTGAGGDHGFAKI